MLNSNDKICVRSVSMGGRTKMHLLKQYTRLTYGSLLDDAIDALWDEYIADGHDLPDLEEF